MVASKSKKKLVRDLQELRGISYQAAYNELLGLPPDVAWRGYIEKIREQQKSGASIEPKDGPREGDAQRTPHQKTYPEHVKLKSVKPRSQAIGEFLEWLASEKRIALAVQHEHTESCYEEKYIRCGYSSGEYLPAQATTRGLLAEFFEIDEVKLEREKRMMLADLRGEMEDDES